jgi:hypothetical protein
LLDIAAAAGHMDWTCDKKLIEPILDAYHNVHEVAMGIISGRLGLRGGFDVILVRRAGVPREKGFQELDIQDPQDRALTRLLCMGGVADLKNSSTV